MSKSQKLDNWRFITYIIDRKKALPADGRPLLSD